MHALTEAGRTLGGIAPGKSLVAAFLAQKLLEVAGGAHEGGNATDLAVVGDKIARVASATTNEWENFGPWVNPA